jgi:chaperonin GroES
METKMKMLRDNILVKPEAPDQKSKGGIFIPDNFNDVPNRGVVLSVGPDAKVSVGDRITFGRFCGVPINIDGTGHLIMKGGIDSDVFAIHEQTL